jgi:hypothetical protein
MALPLASVGFWGEITSNVIFMAGFWGWAIAQIAKVFTYFVKKGVWDITQVVSAGGMPSSHSSLCMVRVSHVLFCAGDASSQPQHALLRSSKPSTRLAACSTSLHGMAGLCVSSVSVGEALRCCIPPLL